MKTAPRTKINGVPVFCSYDEIVAVKDLKPNPDNPNRHPDEQIEKLAYIIKKNGWRDRITVSTRSGMIVKGHGRLQAALISGFTRVPVDYQNYKSDAAELADLIADNVIAELSIVDDDAARALVNDLNDFDLQLAGMDEIEETIDAGGQDLIDAIDAEIEVGKQAERTVEDVKELINVKLDAIAEKNPAELNAAQAVLISSAKNCNDFFLLADPNLKDFISELKRYAESGVESPLEEVLKSHYSMKGNQVD